MGVSVSSNYSLARGWAGFYTRPAATAAGRATRRPEEILNWMNQAAHKYMMSDKWYCVAANYVLVQTEVTKKICCHFRNCHPCGWVTARRVEGGYPKYQRWPGAVKMRRGDFHESCVAGAGCCQAPPSSYLPSQHLPLPPSKGRRTGSQQQPSSNTAPCRLVWTHCSRRNCRQEITEKHLLSLHSCGLQISVNFLEPAFATKLT